MATRSGGPSSSRYVSVAGILAIARNADEAQISVIVSSRVSKSAGVGVLVLLASIVMGLLPVQLAVAASAAGSGVASQQAVYQGLLAGEPRPAGRQNAAFAYDPRLREFVLFGGQSATTVLGDTWIRRHASWIRLHPARAPSARTGAALVYDRATRQLLLFGGSSKPAFGGGFSNQTWIWTGTTWRQLHPAASPRPRHAADMIYDAATHEVILFGGFGGVYLDDTWSWNGTTWHRLHPSNSPSPRDTEALVYDPASKMAILYGGFSLATGRLTDTWSWNGRTWLHLRPATSPGRVSVGWQAAFDAASRQVLLFGGDTDSGPPGNGTWKWNGSTWVQLDPALSPPGRGGGTMTYDSTSKRLYLFGGFTNAAMTKFPRTTWRWNGKTWHPAARQP